MSERLIVEFYDSRGGAKPLISVLAYYGGDEPEAAAYTLVAFFSLIACLKDPRFDEPGILAARFIHWMGHECIRSEALCDFDGVEIIRDSSRYTDYLTARVYPRPSGPLVKFVDDSRNTPEEFRVAEAIANRTW